jgi:hypothetical protein
LQSGQLVGEGGLGLLVFPHFGQNARVGSVSLVLFVLFQTNPYLVALDQGRVFFFVCLSKLLNIIGPIDLLRFFPKSLLDPLSELLIPYFGEILKHDGVKRGAVLLGSEVQDIVIGDSLEVEHNHKDDDRCDCINNLS